MDIPNQAIPVSLLSPPLLVQVASVAAPLQEDPAAGDSDELKVKIRTPSHVPPEFTTFFTDQEVLTSA